MRRVQLVGDPRGRARGRASTSDAGPRLRARRSSAGRPRATSATATTASTRAFTGFSRPADATRTRAQVGARGDRARSSPGDVDLVELVYTRFVSVGHAGRRRSRPLMPLDRDEVVADADAGDDADGRGRVRVRAVARGDPRPAAPALRRRRASTPRCSNAAASEHAARQRAMKSATDNADDLITSLTPGHEPRPPGRRSPPRSWRSSAAPRRCAGRSQRPDDLLADTIEGRDADLFAASRADN